MAALFTTVQVSLVILLAVCVAFAAVAWVFGFGQRPANRRVQAGFWVTVGLLIPAIVAAIALQLGARGRLEARGLVPYPGLKQVVGVASGVGREPLWVFTVHGPTDSVLAFYRRAESRDRWTLVAEDEDHLLLERGGERMSVSVAERWNERTATFHLGRTR
jgi:hypothetical protein